MLEIRPAALDDAEALWEAEVQTARTPGHLVSRPYELLLASMEARIRNLVDGCFVVALDGSGRCGHASLEPMSLEAIQHVFRLTLVVHPGHGGRGVGSALVAHLQEWVAAKPGRHKIELLARATNVNALRLYRRCGFVEEGRLRARMRLPSGDFVDDVTMAWVPSDSRESNAIEAASVLDARRSEIRAFLGVARSDSRVSMNEGATVREDGYTRRVVSFVTPDGERVEAFLFAPVASTSGTAVVALHQHNSDWSIGKSELAGLRGDPLQAFGPALARAGLTVLALDALGFESRRGAVGEGAALAPSSQNDADGWLQYYNHAMHRLVRGELLMTKALGDVASAVRALKGVSGVERVGISGHSFGGNIALFAAALDTEIAFACASGAACSFRHKLVSGTGLEMALVIPGFAARFDVDDLMRCIAPRALLVVSSDDDPYSADAVDLVERARPAFRARGADENFEHLHHGRGHRLDDQRFTAIVDWLATQGD